MYKAHGSTTHARTVVAVVLLVIGSSAGCSRARKGPAACVDVGGRACQACRNEAKLPFCAPKLVAPEASGTITVNGQKGCCGFNDPTLQLACNEILRCIVEKGCSQGNSPVACLCGDQDLIPCAKSKKWSGPCTAIYEAALMGGPPGTVISLFGDTKSPIGVANNTFTCSVDASCPCGQKQAEATDGPKARQ